MSEELRPCPFCGNKIVIGSLDPGWAECDQCGIVEKQDKWNNAWAHKRIEELEKELLHVKTEYSDDEIDLWKKAETRVAALSEELRKIIKAGEGIANMQWQGEISEVVKLEKSMESALALLDSPEGKR